MLSEDVGEGEGERRPKLAEAKAGVRLTSNPELDPLAYGSRACAPLIQKHMLGLVGDWFCYKT